MLTNTARPCWGLTRTPRQPAGACGWAAWRAFHLEGVLCPPATSEGQR